MLLCMRLVTETRVGFTVAIALARNIEWDDFRRRMAKDMISGFLCGGEMA